ncbi:galactose mutarotase [Massilia sp. PAMC28688]|uniref:aldose epimerase family protein n=1 Tax=Massilia sp. PAMC28688 TaxID=2861283 RepID=UPI001C6281B4|nr:aldose epimerase family protein [Massilia sp. PAMC28688]QYF93683.1 galactose mutarotase [Massilia sp. PAMC28688]
MPASFTCAPFGTLPDGRAVQLFTLTNAHGLKARVTNFGGIITELHTPDRHGRLQDIVLGFDTLAPYLGESPYFGALIGRYGNRIREGRFMLDGETFQLSVNNGRNHLHGGVQGFHKVLWDAQPFQGPHGAGLVLTYRSSDGEEGYPGNVDVEVRYELTDDNAFVMHFSAVTDRATPVNLTQHSYFNLAGAGNILGHELTLDAAAYIPIDAQSIPLGEIAPVAETPFDFRLARPIGAAIGAEHPQLKNGGGYDHTFVLTPSGGELRRAARLVDAGSGRTLELFTDQPGVQFYSGNFLDSTLSGKGQTYAYRTGLCLEPQHFPDSPNQPTFPDTILRPGQHYATVSSYRFSVQD